MLVASTPAAAGRQGSYPTFGMLWMSNQVFAPGNLLAYTTDCRPEIVDAMNASWVNILSSTRNKPELDSWVRATGVNYGTRCDGSVWWDYRLTWNPNPNAFVQPNTGGRQIGGRIVHSSASSAFCANFGKSPPCGHRDTTDYNLDKFMRNSPTYRKELILHEQGHAHDLTDNCRTDSLMANAFSDQCPWGGSLQPPGFQVFDRNDVNATYP